MNARLYRTESREVWPFPHATGVFDGSALKLDPTGEFDPSRSTFALDEQALGADLRWELLLKVDARRLRQAARVPPEETEVGLLLENNDARRHEVLMRWRLSELPSRVDGVVPLGRYGPTRVRFRLVAFLNRQRPTRVAAGSSCRLGSVLAERLFSVGLSPANLFRVHWTSFRAQGWDALALWHVQVMNARLLSADAEPDDVLQVHLNKDLPALHALLEPSATRSQRLSPVAALLRPLITSEVLSEVACIVLRHLEAQGAAEDDSDTERVGSASFASAVLRGLKKGTKLDSMELLSIARQEPERLKLKIQGFVGAGRNYDQNTLDRLRS